jgi:tetratricopeptide (TPR) repeat protein
MRGLRCGILLLLATPSGWAQEVDLQKAFLGSYGVHSDVEPPIGPADRTVLEKVWPLVSTDPDGAAKLLLSARKPESTAQFDLVLGNIAFQADRTAEAEAHFRDAVTKFPSFRRAWRNLGLIQASDQRHDEAIHSFTRMIELGGNDAISLGLLGGAYFATHDYLAAEGAYRQALLLEPSNVQWRIGLARAVLQQEKFEEAAALLTVLLEREPERTEFWILQANAYVGMKQPLRAAENLELLALLGRATVETMNLLGNIYLSEGQVDLAAGAYSRAIDLDPTQSPAKALRAAEMLGARGAATQAGLVATKIRGTLAATLTEEQAHQLTKLEARIAIAAGDETVALPLLEEIVARDPLDGEALLLIGQHHAREGDPERAVVYFERAANVPAYEAQARLRQAQVLVGQGKYQDALPLLRRVQELKPQEQVARYLAQVERLARATN